MSNKRKIFSVGITKSGELQNLRENLGPIAPLLDGLVWVFHEPDDEGRDYLKSIKGAGEILRLKWVGRYDFSRNFGIFSGVINHGDYCIQQDTLEKIEPSFITDKLPKLLDFCEQNLIEAVYLHSKIFIFKYLWGQSYSGGVHEGLQLVTNRAIELTQIPLFSNSAEYFTNTRPLKRDDFHIFRHFAGYYFLPDNARQIQMSLDKNYPKEQWQEKYLERIKLRDDFRDFCRRNEIPLDFQPFSSYITSHKAQLPLELIGFINREKILNDLYRYLFKSPETLPWDAHSFSDVITVNEDGSFTNLNQNEQKI